VFPRSFAFGIELFLHRLPVTIGTVADNGQQQSRDETKYLRGFHTVLQSAAAALHVTHVFREQSREEVP
jgi:hypothetical protein